MKKLAATLFMSSALLAGIAEAAWETNFLAGVSTGYINQDGSLGLGFNQNALGLLESGSVQLSQDNFYWGLVAGWQARCNRMLYGAEINVDWQNKSTTNLYTNIPATPLTPSGSVYTSYRNDIAVGITGRVGYVMTSFLMPYVRFGTEAAREKLESTITFVIGPSPFASLEGRKTSWRYLTGIGVELPFPLIEGSVFRMEYDYRSRVAVEASGIAADGTTIVFASSGQVAHSGVASLIYNFL